MAQNSPSDGWEDMASDGWEDMPAAPKAPSNKTPSTLDMLQKAGDWFAGLGNASRERLAREHPERLKTRDMIERLSAFALPASLGKGAPEIRQPPEPPPPSPVEEQLARTNALNPPPAAAQEGKSLLPKTLDLLLHPKRTLLKTALEALTSRGAPPPQAPPSNPYPSEQVTPRVWRPPPPPPPAEPAPLSPELQAAQESSRARVMAQIQQHGVATTEATPPLWQPPPPPPPPRPMTEMSPELQAAQEASRARVMSRIGTPDPTPYKMAPPAPEPRPDPLAAPESLPTPGNIYETAARAKKVAELVKVIDANAGAHIGADLRDPRAVEALGALPDAWWEGMAKVAKINKPSKATIEEAMRFFKDRASQKMAAGQ